MLTCSVLMWLFFVIQNSLGEFLTLGFCMFKTIYLKREFYTILFGEIHFLTLLTTNKMCYATTLLQASLFIINNANLKSAGNQ